MSEPISAPAPLASENAPIQDPRPLAGAVPGPTGPAGGYAAISIGRWWQGAKSAASR